MAEPIVADVSASATTREPLKPAPVIDRYALLRLRQAQGGRGSQMVDFLSARSRANSALMSSQF